MNYSFHIGIDMSKLTFDYCLIDDSGKILKQGVSVNKKASIETWISELSGEFGGSDFWAKTLLCMEHSGYYGTPLLSTLNAKIETDIWLENALRIKRSMGIQRGKNDKVDAERIASYCLDSRRKVALWKPTEANIERLGLLLSHRDRMVKNLMSLRNTLNEEVGFVLDELHDEMAQISAPAIASMEESVKEFDARIDALLKGDTKLARLTEIVRSLPGFGPVITPKLIEVTRGFTRLNDPRSFACFAGVAPFEYSSGTSIKGKTRVSHLANKDIKKMLHLAALVTIRKGNIMHDYFHRKVAEGKNKMLVINAVRNKLIHILCACIKNNTTYQKNYHHSLA